MKKINTNFKLSFLIFCSCSPPFTPTIGGPSFLISHVLKLSLRGQRRARSLINPISSQLPQVHPCPYVCLQPQTWKPEKKLAGERCYKGVWSGTEIHHPFFCSITHAMIRTCGQSWMAFFMVEVKGQCMFSCHTCLPFSGCNITTYAHASVFVCVVRSEILLATFAFSTYSPPHAGRAKQIYAGVWMWYEQLNTCLANEAEERSIGQLLCIKQGDREAKCESGRGCKELCEHD